MNGHRFYYDLMPRWSKNYSPPLGWYNYAYYFVRPYAYIHHVYMAAKWFIQRGRRGYADHDVWGWNMYMADINVKALKTLAANKIGHPCGMTGKGWQTRLLKMIDGFQAIIEEDNDMESYKTLSGNAYRLLMRSRQRRFRAGMKLYTQHFQSLWD